MQTRQLERTITSMEVAGMVEKDHNHTMKDIRRIIDHLGEVKSYQSYFIESTYENTTKQS
ncbi:MULTISPECIES: Rha family transcriptional regulator [Carnobacterium]|uniref:Rha family transcriptional regulator n=1 Tax=Carnobacterium TaxID=2747 RepID=UPI002890A523|nr:MULTISPECIES: Rha family transcriptional regulator [Carnobacterium]MDT1939692.1 Rha family transcriptional regulator [Carnobacterium divergens]MDT1942130.1 Rha family transcriptional regulator [Carnobacterium divergens]MDT1947928.1 Rha family transcriptional regulator [Carnobacterium divergens]MDT1950416.1 Rha family transcriptional regulator [Carnobacterium divergens]MDT1955594.1 Rha family transcriptional regulator [Carnobacterium divergens]